MDRSKLLELVPHYLAMFVLVFLALAVVQAAIGQLGFWLELAIVAVVVFSYRPIVTRLGYAPRAWERRGPEEP